MVCGLPPECGVISQLCRCFHLKTKLLINPLRVHGPSTVIIPFPHIHSFLSSPDDGDDFKFPMTILPNPQKHRDRREVSSKGLFSTLDCPSVIYFEINEDSFFPEYKEST